jgi:hypothetical protein
MISLARLSIPNTWNYDDDSNMSDCEDNDNIYCFRCYIQHELIFISL